MAPTRTKQPNKPSGAKPKPSQGPGGKPRPYAKAESAAQSGPVTLNGLAVDFFKVEYLKDRQLVAVQSDVVPLVVKVKFTPKSNDGLRWESPLEMSLGEFGAWRAKRSAALRDGDVVAGWENEVAKIEARLGLSGFSKPQILGKAASAALLSILSPRERQIFSATQKKYDKFISSKLTEYLAASKKEHPPSKRVSDLNKFFDGKATLPNYIWKEEGNAEFRNKAMEDFLMEAPIASTTRGADAISTTAVAEAMEAIEGVEQTKKSLKETSPSK